VPAFLAGGGVMGAIMRAHDWSTTALGEPSTWPQSLRSAVSMCIAARSVGAIYWGPEFRLIYNDGYRPFLDGRHPWALGRTMAEISPTLWQALQEPAQAVLDTGEGFVAERQRLLMERGNGAEETFWYYSLAPIRGEAGTVEGIFLTALDTTEEVRAEQARNEGERRLATARDAAGLSADFRVLFEASPTPFLVVAPPDWTIVAVNDARLSLTGSTREEQIGRRLFDLFPDDPDDPDADGVRNLTASFERLSPCRCPTSWRSSATPFGTRTDASSSDGGARSTPPCSAHVARSRSSSTASRRSRSWCACAARPPPGTNSPGTSRP